MAADEGTSGSGRAETQAPTRRRQPVYIVCSPRSRVGRSLIARILTEYLIADGRRALAFDVNPEDRALARHLPLHAMPGSIHDTRGQVALFDRLIINDGAVKVVDLAGDQFHAFFDIMYQVGFTAEAKQRGIDLVVLFVMGDDRRSDAAYRRLLLRRDQFIIVPVENPGVATPPAPTSPPLPHGAPPLIIPVLPPAVREAADRSDFSFADCLKRPLEHPTALAEWVGRMFFAFRDMELRLQIADVTAMIRP